MADPGSLFESAVLSVTRRGHVRGVIERSPGSREVLHRFIAGTTAFQALSAARDLQATGRSVAIGYLGTDGETHDAALAELLGLIDVAAATGRTANGGLDVGLRPSSLGDLTAAPGTTPHAELLDRVRRVVRAASNAGATVTLEMEGVDSVDATLALAAELRADDPTVGVTVQAGLRRAEADCRALADAAARVRLCKGAYATEDAGVGSRREVDKAFVRCLGVLLRGSGRVGVATHDGRLVAITDAMASALERPRGSYEYEMYLGVRPVLQTELADRGDSVRVYVPYGPAWYSYLTERVAERPSTSVGLLRSVARLK